MSASRRSGGPLAVILGAAALAAGGPAPLPAAAAHPGLEPTAACIQLPEGRRCLDLPQGATLFAGAPTRDGWVAAGTLAADGRRDLFLVAERGGELELLEPPANPTARPRGGPVVLVHGGELAGLAWLEGTRWESLAVRASSWQGGAWGRPEDVAPPASRVALAGTTLADGRWLLAWSEFDGHDDEVLVATGHPGRWSAPRRLQPDNATPDVLPAVAPLGDGAVLAWSGFDGRDYRLRLARLARGRWEKATTLPGRGGLDAGLHWAGGRLWLLYSSVVPEGWHLAELDAGGAPVADGVIPGPIDERPFLRLDGAEPTLVWSRDEFPRSAVGGERFLWEAPTGSTFRYMAFGDSITKGVEDECNQNCDANGANCGYPKRLPTSTYLNCAVNACQVVNKGKGGETTAQGVTRIQTVLEDNGPWDEVLLMEGTNDICWNDFSNNTIENNLETMESLATAAGVETLHASIIHICGDTCEPGFECPSSLPDPEGRVEDLRERIRDNLANVDPDTSHRWWSDPWSVLCPTQSCFNQHYADWGHPDCSGYDLMTDVFRDAILAKPEPGAPTAVGPVGTIADSSPTFEWDKEVPRDATWYQFQLDGPGGNLEDDWFAETAVCTGSDCTLGVGTLPDGAYTWRVRGRNAAGRSAWVETTFTIQTVLPPGPPTPVAPTGTIGDDRPEFTWLRETPTAATSYELEVSDEAGVILDQTYSPFLVCAGTTCTVDPFDLGDPLAAGDYSWRVRGANVAGAGPWTEPLAFTVIPGLLFTDGFESGDTTAWSEEQL